MEELLEYIKTLKNNVEKKLGNPQLSDYNRIFLYGKQDIIDKVYEFALEKLVVEK